jgi:transposase
MAQRRRRRRVWEDEEKRRIVAQTRVPGVSVSQVARRYDVNANLVFKWLRDPRFGSAGEEVERFVPVTIVDDPGESVAAPVAPADQQIEIELPNGCRVRVSGSFDADVVCRLIRGVSR